MISRYKIYLINLKIYNYTLFKYLHKIRALNEYNKHNYILSIHTYLYVKIFNSSSIRNDDNNVTVWSLLLLLRLMLIYGKIF